MLLEESEDVAPRGEPELVEVEPNECVVGESSNINFCTFAATSDISTSRGSYDISTSWTGASGGRTIRTASVEVVAASRTREEAAREIPTSDRSMVIF